MDHDTGSSTAIVHIGGNSVDEAGRRHPGFVDRIAGRTGDHLRLAQPARRSPVAPVIDRLPPQSIEAEQSVLGADPHRPRRDHRGRRVPPARGLLPAGPRPHLRARSWTSPSGANRSTSSPSPRRWSARGDLEAIGGRAYLGELSQPDAHRRPRRPVRADRRAQGAAAEPDRRGRPDRRDRLRGSRRRSRRRSTARSRSCSRSARSASTAGFSRAQGACSTTPTTGSTTSTRTAARSAASAPGSRTWTR